MPLLIVVVVVRVFSFEVSRLLYVAVFVCVDVAVLCHWVLTAAVAIGDAVVLFCCCGGSRYCCVSLGLLLLT